MKAKLRRVGWNELLDRPSNESFNSAFDFLVSFFKLQTLLLREACLTFEFTCIFPLRSKMQAQRFVRCSPCLSSFQHSGKSVAVQLLRPLYVYTSQ